MDCRGLVSHEDDHGIRSRHRLVLDEFVPGGWLQYGFCQICLSQIRNGDRPVHASGEEWGEWQLDGSLSFIAKHLQTSQKQILHNVGQLLHIFQSFKKSLSSFQQKS